MILSMEHFFVKNKFGEEQTFKMFKEAGFDGVDYSFNSKGDGTAIDLSDHVIKAQETKRLLDKYGLKCNQAHAPFSVRYGEKFDESNENFKDTVRSFEYASIIGVKTIVVHSIKVPAGVDFYNCNYKFRSNTFI